MLKSFGRTMMTFGFIGLGVGVLLFILTQVGVEIPVVIGTTSYEGMAASLFLLIGSPIVLLVIGLIVSLFNLGGKK
ncbi:hypothetical protein [Paenibacillus sp. DMB20]|uniref:hypothetical protein n=1 Tax=Paenibacillus sp. DMB20 TaxID=1642570 RepID=UPI000627BFD2|nr:hypothetical protein [Paenibacillus sp. DMB20]KKO54035.1 hypothetical protein XI25_07945 [Paenibacillus sp. DMB20]